MKKHLLLASAAAVCLMASAQTALQPQVIAGEIVARISPNGEWISNHDVNFGVITVTNLVTGERYVYESNEETGKLYTAGLGNCLSDNGIVLGTDDVSASVIGYGEKGVWHTLPTKPDDTGMCSVNGISADGKVICGHIGNVSFGADDGSIMVHPAIWTRNEDGTYGMYQDLPYPTKDFLGQTPQYITAVCISGDGKTIAGQIVSNSGMFTEPILYTQAEDGTWSYTLVNSKELFKPDGVEYPTYPSDQPEYPNIQNYATADEIAAYNAAVEVYNNYQASMPQMTDFMTEEELAAYQEAVDNWTPEVSTFLPSPEEFMTSEELQAYNAAVEEFYNNYPPYPSLLDYMSEEEVAKYAADEEAYNVAIEEWYTKYDEYQAALDELTADVPHFIFNTITLSNNGRFLGLSNQEQAMFWGQQAEAAIIYVFDLEAGTYCAHTDAQDLDMLVCFIGDEGQVLGAGPSTQRKRNAYYCQHWYGEGGFQPIQDVVKDADPALYEWMTENMRHTYESEELDRETWELVTVEHVDEWLTGTPYATPDLKTIVTWQDNEWDFEAMDQGYWSYSYILPMNNVDGQASVAASELGIKTARGGKIALNGAAKSVIVYDINGREVYSNYAPGSVISTGLGQGIYLIKATDAAGRTATAKAAF